jgi:hypothetical protein
MPRENEPMLNDEIIIKEEEKTDTIPRREGLRKREAKRKVPQEVLTLD